MNSFVSKLAPLTTKIPDSDAELNDKAESVTYLSGGTSFDKKEFKINVTGSDAYAPLFNSLTAIRVLAGTKNSRPVGFYSRNSTKSTINHKHNNPQI